MFLGNPLKKRQSETCFLLTSVEKGGGRNTTTHPGTWTVGEDERGGSLSKWTPVKL